MQFRLEIDDNSEICNPSLSLGKRVLSSFGQEQSERILLVLSGNFGIENSKNFSAKSSSRDDGYQHAINMLNRVIPDSGQHNDALEQLAHLLFPKTFSGKTMAQILPTLSLQQINAQTKKNQNSRISGNQSTGGTAFFNSSGCPIVDDFLQYGFRAPSIVDICGQAGVGKTQLALQSIVTALYGDFSHHVIYFNTEGTFPFKRFLALSENMIRLDPSFQRTVVGVHDAQVDYLIRANAEKMLNRVHLIKPSCLEHFLELLQDDTNNSLCNLILEHNIPLIIVDSITALIRPEIDDLCERSRALCIISHHLKCLSVLGSQDRDYVNHHHGLNNFRKRKLLEISTPTTSTPVFVSERTILVINQVSDFIVKEKSTVIQEHPRAGDLIKIDRGVFHVENSSLRYYYDQTSPQPFQGLQHPLYGDVKVAALGLVWANCVNMRILLMRDTSYENEIAERMGGSNQDRPTLNSSTVRRAMHVLFSPWGKNVGFLNYSIDAGGFHGLEI